MYRIKSRGIVIFDQLLAEDVLDKFDRGLAMPDIQIERLNTYEMIWEKIPLQKFFTRTIGV